MDSQFLFRIPLITHWTGEDGHYRQEEIKIVTPERFKMKRRTIDMVIRHQRNSSLSSLGSGDWGSDVGASVEDRSSGDQSASDQSGRVRIVAEMAILASTSPEIKALSQKRGEGFQQTINGAILPSPSSSVASSTVSRNSIASLISEESKCDDMKDTAKSNHGTADEVADKLAALSFENLCIEPPPSPKREPDIATFIDNESKENNIEKRYKPGGVDTANSGGQGHRTRRNTHASSSRSSQRESFGSCASSGNSKRPPKPLKPAVVTPRSPVRRPSMHRRVSFDSLPTPSEIGAAVPPLFCNGASPESRSFFSGPTVERSSPFLSSSSEQSQKPNQRRGTSTPTSERSSRSPIFSSSFERRRKPNQTRGTNTPTSERSSPYLRSSAERSQKPKRRLVKPRSLNLSKGI